MKALFPVLAAVALSALAHPALAADAAPAAKPRSGAPGSIERGRYLARTAGCNDCHTPGYVQSAGTVPEKVWLTGDHVGWSGPWGTTYPSNLRLALARMSEKQWIESARSRQLRPPMPWFALRDMSDDDLRAIYRYVKHLGPAGDPAPGFLPPGTAPRGAVIRFPG